jgi:hypothetical protein
VHGNGATGISTLETSAAEPSIGGSFVFKVRPFFYVAGAIQQPLGHRSVEENSSSSQSGHSDGTLIDGPSPLTSHTPRGWRSPTIHDGDAATATSVGRLSTHAVLAS